MNTSKFVSLYGDTMKTLKEQCILLDDGVTCCDGAKCDIKVKGFKDMSDFVKCNSAFYIKDLSYVMEAMPKNFHFEDFKLRLCVKNTDLDGNNAWEGEAVYTDCWHMPFCDTRDHIFSEDYCIDDGFVVFDKVRITKEATKTVIEKKVEPKTSVADDRVENNSVTTSYKSIFEKLDDLMKAFNEYKADKDDFYKSFSYTVDGNGNVKAEQNINGDKKNYTFKCSNDCNCKCDCDCGGKPSDDDVDALNRLAD